MPSIRWFRIGLASVAVFALTFSGFALLAIVTVNMLNAELYGRLTQTQSLSSHVPTSDQPLVRLVLHRILPDENAVEASLQLVVNEGSVLGVAIKSSRAAARVVIEDASSERESALIIETPPMIASAFRPGRWSGIVRSERFLLPMYPSVSSYPFDDVRMRVFINFYTSEGLSSHYRTEVQKAFPGRLLAIFEDGGGVGITLSRTPSEKGFIVTASAVFLLLSLAVTAGLFISPRGLTSFEQLIAVAGYLLAAAGFRELLGVSRVVGTTLLEILILGVPLVLLSFGVALSMYRGVRANAKRP